jgi:hypothetical protein
MSDKPGSRAEALLAEEAREAERRIARSFAIGLPVATLAGAVGVGVVGGLAPALLTVAGGVVLGTIATAWASLRTLAGDAPLPRDLEIATMARGTVDEKVSRKRMLLRALKDLENEHRIGKLDDEDYDLVAARYRAELKALMKQMDEELRPYREKAERALAAHLAKVGLGENANAEAAPSAREETPRAPVEEVAPAPTRTCAKCATVNDADAKFCKECAAKLEAGAEPQGDA